MKKIILILVVVVSLNVAWKIFQNSNEADSLIQEAYNKKKISNAEIKEFDGFVEPSIPDEKKNLIELGVDSNGNGIRDDLDIWINRSFGSYNERMAMRQYASDLNYILSAAKDNNPDKISHAVSIEFTTFGCLEFIFKSYMAASDVSAKVKMLTYNSNEKRKLLENLNNFSYSYGSVVPNMKIGEEWKGCNFKIQGMSELILNYQKKLRTN